MDRWDRRNDFLLKYPRTTRVYPTDDHKDGL